MTRHPLYGLLAEFDSPEALLEAANRTHQAGYTKIDAFTPFPIEGLADAIGFHKTNVPLIVLIGGLIGCTGGWLLQFYPNVIGYPLNIGGRPHYSWPSFVPIMFEMTILCAALSAVFGMLALNGLPTPYHPVFKVAQFALASRSQFFLCIKARDPKFQYQKTREFLAGLNVRGVFDIES